MARVTVVESPDDAAIDVQIWVFDRFGTVESPTPSTAASRPQGRRARRRARSTIDVDDTRLHAVPVERNGRRFGTLVAGVDLNAYEQTSRTALIGSIVLAAVLFGLVLLASRSILRRALEPVSQMTRAAADWSEHNPDRRFARGEPYDELSSLAATLDTLLTRLGNSLRNEQRFSSEMSHELRTPLARIHAEVELALRRERTSEEQRAALAAVGRSAAQMARTIDTLVAVARFEGAAMRGTSDAREAIEHAVEATRPARGGRDIEPQVESPRVAVRLGADAEIVERILAPVIENACRHAASAVGITVARDGTTAVITVTDDGEGIGRPISSASSSPASASRRAPASPRRDSGSHSHGDSRRLPADRSWLRPGPAGASRCGCRSPERRSPQRAWSTTHTVTATHSASTIAAEIRRPSRDPRGGNPRLERPRSRELTRGRPQCE